MMRKFQRMIEDFSCEKCNLLVKGSGYTNHCPRCLWSKHVDINPGDRLSPCGGMMDPKMVETVGKDNAIIHQCIKCNYIKKNKVSKMDGSNVILEVIRTQNK